MLNIFSLCLISFQGTKMTLSASTSTQTFSRSQDSRTFRKENQASCPAPPSPNHLHPRRGGGCHSERGRSASSEHVCTSGGMVMKINVMLSVRTPLDVSSVYPNNLGEPSGAKEPHSAVQGQHLTS